MDGPATLLRLSALLDVPLDAGKLRPPKMQKQGDEINEQFRQRFLDELR